MLSSMFRPNEFSSLKEDFDENSFVFDATTSSTPPQQLQRDEFVDASEEMLLDAVTAPEKGLGVKERDKILDDLKKENFNLKLRIFFLEERLESFCVDGDGKKSKENIILKFQAEIEELELDLMDERNNCKKAMDDYATSNALNKQLEFEIDQLRTEAREFKSIADDAKAVDLELQSIAASESNSKLAESNLPKQKGVAAVKSRIVDLISNNKTLESKANELSAENSQLRENLNKTVESSSQDLSAAQKVSQKNNWT
ncbi:hypothetical protein BDR26DRAFT_695598 [Obelidium mucronatum]|nr:hypothetical protein BDR26DRAFT_695598 [Obelidium mucronatum]